jgi:hypothetical protein
MSGDKPSLHHALLLAAGTLTAIVQAGHIPSTAKITFKDEFAHLGTMTIDEVLDATDVALGDALGDAKASPSP